MKRPLLVFLVIALFGLHQDTWFWRTAQPFVFGFLPIGLFYHICFTLAVSLLMWLLITVAWPAHLEERLGDGATGGPGDESSRRPVAPRRLSGGESPRPPVTNTSQHTEDQSS